MPIAWPVVSVWVAAITSKSTAFSESILNPMVVSSVCAAAIWNNRAPPGYRKDLGWFKLSCGFA